MRWLEPCGYRRRGARLPALLLSLGLVVTSLQPLAAAEMARENRPVSGFHRIAISGPGAVQVRRGGEESLVIEAEPKMLEQMVTEVEGGILHIYRRPGSWGWHGPVRIEITYLALDGLTLSGSADVTTDEIRAGAFEVEISGSSNVTVPGLELAEALSVTISGSGDLEVGRLAAEALSVSVSGSGDMEARGEVDTKTIAVRGSGSVDLRELKSASAQATVSGSGSVRLWATERLQATISGSGDIAYRGEPRLESQISGSGRLAPE